MTRILLLSIAVAGLLSLVPALALAERIGTVTVPRSLPDLPNSYYETPLDSPIPINDSWTSPRHQPLGISLDNYGLTEVQIDAARSTGCGLVRLTIPMEHFIDGADPDWSTLDQVISHLTRQKFEILAVLDAQIAVPEMYRDFCSAVASRYGPTLQYYQLLDNVNYKIGMTSREYADLLSGARTELVLADPDALVVSGGIRGVDITYLEMLNQQGGVRAIDILAFNLTPSRHGIEQFSPVRPDHSLPYMAEAVDWARAHGKRVWVTSLGASTDLSWVGMDQLEQAGVYARSSMYLGWLGVDRVILSAIQDSDPTYQVPSRCCGVLDVTGQPKASYYVLQSLNDALTGAYPVEVPFGYRGLTFQRPEEQDIVEYRRQQIQASQEMFADPRRAAELAEDVLKPFQTHSIQVFSFWFYAPEQREYRMIYWLGEETPYPALMSLECCNPQLQPFNDHLRPTTCFDMLTQRSDVVEYYFAQNLLFLPYQPLGTTPEMIRFQVQGGAGGH
jgi:hypothetical protein